MLYFDNSATTKPKDEVVQAIMPYLTEKWQNPSGLYRGSTRVRKDIEDVRKAIADFINAKPNEIYFTSGAAESNNWVIRGYDDCYGGKIITSVIEHKSILVALQNPKLKSMVKKCDVNADGDVNLTQMVRGLQTIAAKATKPLVSIGFVNNEIGTIQNIKLISQIVHRHNGIFHTDATQALGRIPIDVKRYGIDMLSASAQKIGGLKGVGFLYINENILFPPLIYGTQENGMRGGTENVIGIMSMGAAIESLNEKNMKINRDFVTILKKYLLNAMTEKGIKYKINGGYAVSDIISITLKHDVDGEGIAYMLDASDIYIATGSACNSTSNEPSYVLKAIGLSDEDARRTIRITLSNEITFKYIDIFVNELKRAITNMETMIQAW